MPGGPRTRFSLPFVRNSGAYARPSHARTKAVVLGAVFVLGLQAPAVGREVSVADLVADPGSYEGEITLEGELVGDYGHRRDGSTWAQLNGDSYATSPVAAGGPLTGPNVGVGVRLPTELAETLDGPGGYRFRGPLVRLTGEWKYHDPARGGESYLEVTSVDVIERALRLDERPDWVVIVLGSVLLFLAGLVRIRGRRPSPVTEEWS